MRTTSLFRALAASAAIATATPLAAQQFPLRDLPKPAKELDEPFSMIASVREMKGGKLLVADAVESQIVSIDFATGARKNVGRKGGGPGEYTTPGALFRLPGDTLWVLDIQGGQNGRFVVFNPDGSPGTTFPFLVGFNPADSSTLTQPYYIDTKGMLYAGSMGLRLQAAGNATDPGGGRANINFSDTITIVKFDPRVLNSPRTKLARLRFLSGGGGMKQQVVGTNVKMTAPFFGLTTSDAWTLFPDGRIGIVRAATYTVEYITPTGAKGPTAVIPYEHIKLTENDKKLEMDAARRQMKDQMAVVKRMLPPGFTIEIELTPPPSWPAEYPAISPLGIRANPDGTLWVMRSVPDRIGREQWDVINSAGKLVSRWQLPPKTTLVAFGDGGVLYTVRTDEDDLKYLQRVELPRCTECR